MYAQLETNFDRVRRSKLTCVCTQIPVEVLTEPTSRQGFWNPPQRTHVALCLDRIATTTAGQAGRFNRGAAEQQRHSIFRVQIRRFTYFCMTT